MSQPDEKPTTARATELTPYDTGERCEAKPWIPYGTPVDEATPAANFGKVDFDDDADETVATVYLERQADGTHVLHLGPMMDSDQISVRDAS